MQVGFSAGGGDPGAYWQGLINGVLTGTTNVAINFIGQELDIPPLYMALGSLAITGAIQGALSSDNDIFKGMTNAFKNATLSLLTFGMYDPNTGQFKKDAWSQAAYISQVLDFSQKVQEDGLLEAMEIYTAAIFQGSAVQIIVGEGGIIQLVAKRLQEGRIENIDFKGIPAKKVPIKDGPQGSYFIYSEDETKLLAIYNGNTLIESPDGSYEIGPDGAFGVKNGTITTVLTDGTTVVQHIENRSQIEVVMTTADSQIIRLTPVEGRTNITYDEYGNISDAKFDGGLDGAQAILKDGIIEEYIAPVMRDGDITGQTLIESMGITDEDLRGAEIVISRDASGNFQSTINATPTTYIDPVTQQVVTTFLGMVFPGSKTMVDFMMDPVLRSEVQSHTERIANYFTGFEARTNAEIKLGKANELQATLLYGQDGDMVFVSGADPVGLVVKAGEVLTDGKGIVGSLQLLYNPIGTIATGIANSTSQIFNKDNPLLVNHMGMIKEYNGSKYVMQINPEGVTMVPVETIFANYKDVRVARADDVKAMEAANQMFTTLFDINTLVANENAPEYNWPGLFGIGNRSEHPTNFICSEFVNYWLRQVGVSLNGVVQDLRISPQEIWGSVKQWGKGLTELFGGE